MNTGQPLEKLLRIVTYSVKHRVHLTSCKVNIKAVDVRSKDVIPEPETLHTLTGSRHWGTQNTRRLICWNVVLPEYDVIA